jgi:UDP-N-acetylglucosamine--N-acetylmuramyl-(pentapeptide) pyrophosphoryl-undecaprenol N-acetylglucosamine transferase
MVAFGRTYSDAGMPTLLVASSGGHLQELYELVPRFSGIDRSELTWVTFDTPQARSLLADHEVIALPYTPPRALWLSMTNAVRAERLLRRRKFEVVVSTGSTVAVSFLPVARALGSSCHYIESATRVSRPSLTGEILQRVPGIHLYAQAEQWAGGRWQFRGSVFDGFHVEPTVPEASESPRRAALKVVVSLGSSENFGFRSLVERVVDLLPTGAEVLWQTGATAVDGLPIVARPAVSSDELAAACAASDLVIAHAGVGTALMALRAGRCPVLVPRRQFRGEHVDDHQQQVASLLDRRGIGIGRELDDLDRSALAAAAVRRVTCSDDVAPFHLAGGLRRGRGYACR